MIGQSFRLDLRCLKVVEPELLVGNQKVFESAMLEIEASQVLFCPMREYTLAGATFRGDLAADLLSDYE